MPRGRAAERVNVTRGTCTHGPRHVHRRGPGQGELGSGTVLALALGLVVVMATASMLLLAQAAVAASRAAAAADLAALAAADAFRGITGGEPCAVARDVAIRNNARVLSCLEGAGKTVQVRIELSAGSILGTASGLARAGPPPDPEHGPAP